MRPLPDSDVPVVDPQTGLMTRDWYDYFLELDLKEVAETRRAAASRRQQRDNP